MNVNSNTDNSDSNNSGKLKSYNHLQCLSKQVKDIDLTKDIVPVQRDNQQFTTPSKRIVSKRDLKVFQHSESYRQLLAFILQLSLKVQGLKNNDSEVPITNNIQGLLNILNQLNQFIDEIPPKAKRTRFGNESFVEWFDKCKLEIPIIIKKELFKDEDSTFEQGIVMEASEYLVNAFGDRIRIDYGSGHELNFICFLFTLVKVGIFNSNDYAALVLHVFVSYMTLMRRLQSQYWLEPAGSHGVWGLDDYHFLAFLFGSSQLIEHQHIRPKSIRNQDTVATFANSYMYLSCILFVVRAKTGSLVEHSPMLVDISGVKTWAKVNEGMVKMYINELLAKLPVMQHFLFGSIIPFIDNPDIVLNEEELIKDSKQPKSLNVHTFSSCGCVTRVPSMFSVSGGGNQTGMDGVLDTVQIQSNGIDSSLVDTKLSDQLQSQHHHNSNCAHPSPHNHSHHHNKQIPFD